MLRSLRWFAAFPLLAVASLGAADKKDKEDIALEKHQKVLAEARQRVEQERKQAAQATAAEEKAEDEHRRQRVEYDKIRQQAIDKHDANPQLAKARAEVERAEGELKSVAGPLLKQLESDAAHVARVRERDRQRQLLQNAAPGDKERLAALALAAAQAVTKAENALFDADPATSVARRNVEEARGRLQKLIDDRDRKIAQDVHIQRASTELAGAKRKLDAAQEARERAMRELAAAQKHLAAEEQEHKRLAEAERRDDARDKAAAQKKNNRKK